jgi:hypothetical protein
MEGEEMRNENKQVGMYHLKKDLNHALVILSLLQIPLTLHHLIRLIGIQ